MADGHGRAISASVAGAVAAGYVAILLTRPGSPALTTGLTGGLTRAAILCAGVLWLRAAQWAPGRVRLALRMLGVAIIVRAVGGTIWIGGYLVKGSAGIPIPPLSMAAFAVTMLLGPVAVALLFGNRRIAGVRTLLDAMLIGIGLLYLAWATVLGPTYHVQGGGIPALSSLTYPLVNVVVMTMVLVLVRDAVPVIRTTAKLAATGLAFSFVSDCAYAFLSVEGSYRPGSVSDTGWLLGALVMAVATPRRRELAGIGAFTKPQPSRILLPYLPFILALGTTVVLFVIRNGQVEPTLYAISTVLTVLVVVRQLVTLKDNRTLTQRLERAVEDFRHRAYHDPLTGLANRDKFLEMMERRLAPAAGPRLGVLYIDLDGFKPINDTLGHAAGDRVLTVVAQRLSEAARSDDVVARIGGDEFAIMLAELQYTADAETVAQRIQSALGAGIDIDGVPVRVGASIGIAYGRPGRIGLGELLRNADVAMYTAKLQGRRRTVAFEPHLLSRRPLGQVS
ncbi:GGDEF domain-containing protein [Planosporangium flavigriseum]|uniref:GGDEF domain-containing protein n=1 Tax=Planosporangium flavigriseum TaxID=373681 RepID=A0A8J3LT90_9ACTN|nr:GGDEF domain-containing protein [Planosporangium flavigriseum]NJC66636.1 GGDEF domain-containing protein [Planosporangium flavigriseum]GIG73509.1 hypothetical protein Pfl04_19130 [Planosporangium flavigriseum]